MNIYVGNLPYSTTEQELNEIFAEYGEVKTSKIIFDRETGRSRGFGFVEMNDADANKAIEELNGAEYDGKQLTINEARERTQGYSGGGGNRGNSRYNRR